MDTNEQRNTITVKIIVHGKNVLQKSELTKAMEKRVDEKKKKDLLQQKVNRRNSFEKKLEAQALKIEKECDDKQGMEEKEIPEFLKIRAKVYSSHKITPETQE
ncbi:hypothetical protein B4U80_07869, partial [Leptotrombidium deliense]